MNDPSHANLQLLETQLAQANSSFVPTELRDQVLDKVRRELRASRWDRRLGRAAAALLAVGVVMNVAIIGRNTSPPAGQVASRSTPQAIVELAVNVAEATDAKTARTIAIHLATLSGLPLSSQQTAAIQLEIDRRFPPPAPTGKAG